MISIFVSINRFAMKIYFIINLMIFIRYKKCYSTKELLIIYKLWKIKFSLCISIFIFMKDRGRRVQCKSTEEGRTYSAAYKVDLCDGHVSRAVTPKIAGPRLRSSESRSVVAGRVIPPRRRRLRQPGYAP